MPDDTQKQQDQSPETGDTPASDPATLKAELDKLRAERESLSERLSEVNHESAGRRHRINELEEKLEAFEQQQMIDQGKWKELAEKHAAELEELRPVAEKYQSVREQMMERNQARVQELTALSEDIEGLIPPGLGPEELSQWLDANEATLRKLAQPPIPQTDAGAGSGSGSTRTRQEALPPTVQRLAQLAQANGFQVDTKRLAQRLKDNQ